MTPRVVALAGTIVGIGAYLYLAALHRLPLEDDAYISFRYARNLARGLGLVYNPGEYVEGYTNFLWTLLLSLFYLPGLPVAAIASWLGIACGAGCVWLLIRHGGNTSRPWTLLAPILLATNVYFAYWGGKGMETPLFALLLTGGALALAQRLKTNDGNARWAVWFALAALTRPEGLVFGVFSLVVWAWHTLRQSRGPRPLLVAAALFLLPVLCHFVWRYAYYNDWLPNTYYAKVGGGLVFYMRGADYVRHAMSLQPLWTAGLLLALFSVLRLRAGSRYLLALVGLGLAMSVYEGGDHFYGARMLTPLLPVGYLLGQTALLGWLGARGSRERRAGLVAALLLLVVLIRLPLAAHHDATLQKTGESLLDMQQRERVGLWLRENSAPGDWLATPAAGLLPYVADRPTIDCLGLTDHHIARAPVPLGRGWAGHEKGDADYVLSRRPRFIVPLHYTLPRRLEYHEVIPRFFDRTSRGLPGNPVFQRHYQLHTDWQGTGYVHVFVRRANN